eukprot:3182859-Pleurochrysis_carterae.AAC.1
MLQKELSGSSLRKLHYADLVICAFEVAIQREMRRSQLELDVALLQTQLQVGVISMLACRSIVERLLLVIAIRMRILTLPYHGCIT